MQLMLIWPDTSVIWPDAEAEQERLTLSRHRIGRCGSGTFPEWAPERVSWRAFGKNAKNGPQGARKARKCSAEHNSLHSKLLRLLISWRASRQERSACARKRTTKPLEASPAVSRGSRSLPVIACQVPV